MPRTSLSNETGSEGDCQNRGVGAFVGVESGVRFMALGFHAQGARGGVVGYLVEKEERPMDGQVESGEYRVHCCGGMDFSKVGGTRPP